MFTLLELLRQRRALTPTDLVRLLAALPGQLEASGRRGARPPLLDSVRVQFVGTAGLESGANRLDQPIAEWPPFLLQLELPPKGRPAPPSDTASAMEERQRANADLARLIYELLGGPYRSPAEVFFPPLAALPEAANLALQEALNRRCALAPAEFWTGFLEKCGISLGAPARTAPGVETLQIQPNRASFEMGTVLRLLPDGPGRLPMHFVSRPRFRIGRAPEHADYVTRFLPPTAENEQRTQEISRVHVLGEVSGGRLALRDGNGRHGSMNGSEFNATPLDPERLTPLEQPGVLALGSNFFLQAAPVFLPDAWEISNPLGWFHFELLAAPEVGGLVLEPVAPERPLVRAVWLLNRIGLQVTAEGDLLPDAAASLAPPLLLFHRSSCFLLANLSLPEAMVDIDGAALACGEAAPLRSRQLLRIGAAAWRVTVD